MTTYKMACEPSKDSDQPGHLPSLIRVVAVHMLNDGVHSELTVTALIRLGGCSGYSESLLGAPAILLVLLCTSTYYIYFDTPALLSTACTILIFSIIKYAVGTQ